MGGGGEKLGESIPPKDQKWAGGEERSSCHSLKSLQFCEPSKPHNKGGGGPGTEEGVPEKCSSGVLRDTSKGYWYRPAYIFALERGRGGKREKDSGGGGEMKQSIIE